MMPRPMKPTLLMLHSLPIGTVGRIELQNGSQVRPRPAQSFRRRPGRLVLATNPALVAQLVDELEQERVIDLARAGLVAARVIGQLHMRNALQIALDGWREIAFHDL